MKRARLIVKERITGINNDEGLRALDGIYESPALEFEDEADMQEMLEILENEFKEEYKNLNDNSFVDVVLNEEETNNE